MITAKNILVSISVTCTSLLLTIGMPANAQEKKNEQTNNAEKVKVIQHIAISADLIGPIQMAVSNYGQYEAQARFDIKDKFYPVIELGIGKADATDESTQIRYKTAAPYGRIGCDWNLLKDKHDIYRLFAGFRYAFTSYKFDVSQPHLVDPVWGDDVAFGAENVKANQHWLEAVGGVDVKIWGPIRLGWSLRYKKRIAHQDGSLGKTWYVPGFGKTSDSQIGGTFNFIIEL